MGQTNKFYFDLLHVPVNDELLYDAFAELIGGTGNVAMAQWLVDSEWNAPDILRHAVYISLERGLPELPLALLDRSDQANLGISFSELMMGETARDWVIDLGRGGCVKLLPFFHKKLTKLQGRFRYAFLLGACRGGHLELVKEYFAFDTESIELPDHCVFFGEAAKGGNVDVMAFLIALHNNDVNAIVPPSFSLGSTDPDVFERVYQFLKMHNFDMFQKWKHLATEVCMTDSVELLHRIEKDRPLLEVLEPAHLSSEVYMLIAFHKFKVVRFLFEKYGDNGTGSIKLRDCPFGAIFQLRSMWAWESASNAQGALAFVRFMLALGLRPRPTILQSWVKPAYRNFRRSANKLASFLSLLELLFDNGVDLHAQILSGLLQHTPNLEQILALIRKYIPSLRPEDVRLNSIKLYGGAIHRQYDEIFPLLDALFEVGLPIDGTTACEFIYIAMNVRKLKLFQVKKITDWFCSRVPNFLERFFSEGFLRHFDSDTIKWVTELRLPLTSTAFTMVASNLTRASYLRNPGYVSEAAKKVDFLKGLSLSFTESTMADLLQEIQDQLSRSVEKARFDHARADPLMVELVTMLRAKGCPWNGGTLKKLRALPAFDYFRALDFNRYFIDQKCEGYEELEVEMKRDLEEFENELGEGGSDVSEDLMDELSAEDSGGESDEQEEIMETEEGGDDDEAGGGRDAEGR